MRASPLIVEVTAPFAGRCVALSTDPEDCCLILERLAARKRREAKGNLDPATVAVILTEVDRFEKLITLVKGDLPPRAKKSPCVRPTESVARSGNATANGNEPQTDEAGELRTPHMSDGEPPPRAA